MKVLDYCWGILLLGLLLGTSACDIINSEEPIPAFIHIVDFALNTTVGEGTDSRKITEVFVFVGGDLLGAYSLPADFPVLKTGQQQIQLFPGVQDNGIAATPEIYPFYTTYTTDVELVALETDTIRPVVEYIDGIKFAIQETFENNLQVFREDLDNDPQTQLIFTRDPDEVFEGQQSAKVVVSEENPLFQVGSIRFDALPEINRSAYIELNFRTEVPVEVGILYTDDFARTQADYRNVLAVSTEWKKIYLNVTEQFTVLGGLPDIRDFQIGIRAAMAVENGAFQSGSREILIDNIKLIHF